MSRLSMRVLLFCVLALVATLLVWFSVGLYRWTIPVPTSHPGLTIFRPPHEVSALSIWKGKLWAGGRDGLFALDLKSGELQPLPEPDVPLRFVTSLLAQGGVGLWIGHPGGLTLYDGHSFHTYTERDGLPDRRVNCLLLDSRGTLWVGTWKGSVAFNRTPKLVLNRKAGLAVDMVRTIMEDDEGKLWFGSYVAPGGGLSIPEDGGWRVFDTRDGLPHDNVTSIFQDADGKVWVGTGMLDRGGCAVFSRRGRGWKLEKVYTKKDGLAGEKVRTVFQDFNHVYWVASEYDGVLIMDGNRKRIFREKDGLSSNEVKAFLEDDNGTIWLGTRDGVTRIDPSFLGNYNPDGRAHDLSRSRAKIPNP